MITLHIEANTLAEVRRQVFAALGEGTVTQSFLVEPVETAKADPAKVSVGVSEQVYQIEADDEGELDAQAVQGEGAIDSAGDTWDEAIHSPNKTMTKDGRWRLKKGAVRPEPSASTSGTVSPVEATTETPAGPSTAEDDEFAAFYQAEDVAVVEVPARSWTEADLSKITNQAAQKLGNPTPIKDLIAKFTPADLVPHSRNIPADKRESFAVELEKLAGIEFVG